MGTRYVSPGRHDGSKSQIGGVTAARAAATTDSRQTAVPARCNPVAMAV